VSSRPFRSPADGGDDRCEPRRTDGTDDASDT
jgi:hypothetical protein